MTREWLLHAWENLAEAFSQGSTQWWAGSIAGKRAWLRGQTMKWSFAVPPWKWRTLVLQAFWRTRLAAWAVLGFSLYLTILHWPSGRSLTEYMDGALFIQTNDCPCSSYWFPIVCLCLFLVLLQMAETVLFWPLNTWPKPREPAAVERSFCSFSSCCFPSTEWLPLHPQGLSTPGASYSP